MSLFSFFFFYLDIVLSRSVRRVKPFPASYATASFILFPIKKNKPKVQREKTMSRRYIGVYQASSPLLHPFPNRFNEIPSSTWTQKIRETEGDLGRREKKKKKKKWRKERFILFIFERFDTLNTLNIQSSVYSQLLSSHFSVKLFL